MRVDYGGYLQTNCIAWKSPGNGNKAKGARLNIEFFSVYNGISERGV